MDRPALISFEEAKQAILKSAQEFKVEEIETMDALGRVIAEDVTADRDYPPFNRSAMDGFAIRLEDYEKGNTAFEIEGELFAGQSKDFKGEANQCVRIMTGAAVPSVYDCVVRIEDCQFDDKTLTLLEGLKLKPFNNIAQQGEDLQNGQPVMGKGTKVDHAVYSLLATLGKSKIKVFQQPKVAIIATGDELKKIDEPVEPYQIRESNSFVLTGLLKNLGIDPAFRGMVIDDKEAMRKTLLEVSSYDIIILTGGVSMGAADFVPEILDEIGAEKVFHKVAIKPGKPIWFGKKERGVVFALPGNPLSSQVTFKLFVEPYIQQCMGIGSMPQLSPLRKAVSKKNPLDQFFPIKFTIDNKVEFLPFNGSGDITASLGSDGIGRHRAQEKELAEGSIIEVYPW